MQNKNFEEAIKELEKIVHTLEKGDISLDESVKEFGKGIELSNYCNKVLEEAEKKIVLLTGTDGQIIEESFDAN